MSFPFRNRPAFPEGGPSRKTSRRELIKASAATCVCGFGLARAGALTRETVKPRDVAAVVTVYRPNSHADVILTKIMEGWRHDGKAGPALRLASLYVDQFPANDLARALARKHKVPIFKTIAEAVTVGGNTIPVDAVLSIGEHGDYPANKIGQQLYPRRRFFREIADAFQKYGRVVPVFNDKHLGPVWEDARWMYERAAQLKIPLLAGSSLPLSFRTRRLELPLGSDIEAAVGIGHGNLDRYGFHALECFQALAERRRHAEVGVRWVRCLEGKALWHMIDEGFVRKDVLAAAEDAVPSMKRRLRADENLIGFLFEYRDGFRGAVLMTRLARWNAVAVKVRQAPAPIATAIEERREPRYPHFAYLLKAIETMVHTGRAPYPVERTLLTSGILDRALHSRVDGGRQRLTTELAIAYRPVDYPHAPEPDLLASPPRG